jgi:hypothetical protein
VSVRTLLLETIIVISTAAPAADAQPVASKTQFQDGFADRVAFEAWFNSLPLGEYRAGAEYWASVRSTAHPTPCSVLGGEATKGCLAARERLNPSDARRVTEPMYRAGWSSFSIPVAQPQSLPAAPAASAPPAAAAASAPPATQPDRGSVLLSSQPAYAAWASQWEVSMDTRGQPECILGNSAPPNAVERPILSLHATKTHATIYLVGTIVSPKGAFNATFTIDGQPGGWSLPMLGELNGAEGQLPPTGPAHDLFDRMSRGQTLNIAIPDKSYDVPLLGFADHYRDFLSCVERLPR